MNTRFDIMVDKKDLIDAVIDQIIADYKDGDMTAVWELLSFIPKENLLEFLPEEQWSKF